MTVDDTKRRTLSANLEAVRGRIAAAAQRAGRDPSEITLVAVTKQVGVEEAQWLIDCGVTDLGENRPQELQRKAASVVGPVRWHLIGQLQRNKVRRVLPLTTLIHSGDRWELLAAMDGHAADLGLTPHVLLEVNVAGETSKAGWQPDQLLQRARDLMTLGHLSIDGLMTMAPLVNDPENARAVFAGLSRLRDELHRHCDRQLALNELSMGMSNDFEVAIAEGATLVRVGSALFQYV